MCLALSYSWHQTSEAMCLVENEDVVGEGLKYTELEGVI